MNIRPVGAELFHADLQKDRQTDRHEESNYRFSQFFESALKMSFKDVYEVVVA